jgi:hypothetical protein
MTSRTLPLAPLRARVAATRPRAIGLLAHWCASRFTRPLYHRLGAFDLARSGLAASLLEGRPRR